VRGTSPRSSWSSRSFQVMVFGEAIPHLVEVLWGGFLVVFGLTLFVQGLKLGVFPIGETMAWDFARKGSLPWLLPSPSLWVQHHGGGAGPDCGG